MPICWLQNRLGLALVALSVLKDKSAGRYYIKSRKQILKKRFETFLTVCVFFIKRSLRPLLFTGDEGGDWQDSFRYLGFIDPV